MIKVDGNAIYLTRGDTGRFEIRMENGDGSEYVPVPGDKLRFAMKRALMNAAKTEFLEARPVLLVDIPIDTRILEIQPVDTKKLGFGEYRYDIELSMADGTVDTFIADASFILTPEVY